MTNGRDVAQSICDWIVRYAKVVDEEDGEFFSSSLYGFASVLQTMIDEGIYDK